ncbi:MAG: hypothetical protein HY897_24890 [Deltaproteobacteria bacterium]|nr:hypothetical protein [Deltaproteobacteria bacterium]
MAGSLLVAGLGGVILGAPAFFAGMAGFYLGPPIVHASHGNAGRAFASLGVGVGGTVVSILATGLILGAVSEPCRSECGMEALAAVFLGGIAGGLIYAVVDIGFLAYDVREHDAKRPTDTSSFRLVPKVWFAQNQTTIGMSGEF